MPPNRAKVDPNQSCTEWVCPGGAYGVARIDNFRPYKFNFLRCVLAKIRLAPRVVVRVPSECGEMVRVPRTPCVVVRVPRGAYGVAPGGGGIWGNGRMVEELVIVRGSDGQRGRCATSAHTSGRRKR